MKPKLYRKFRAVEHKTDKFVYGAYVEYADQDRPDEIIEDNGTVHKVASFTVGEFIGFFYGFKVFEGDIIHLKGKEYDKALLDSKDISVVQLEVSMFERVQHICKYRCAKIGDTYKCANGKSFGETCSKQNCPIIK